MCNTEPEFKSIGHLTTFLFETCSFTPSPVTPQSSASHTNVTYFIVIIYYLLSVQHTKLNYAYETLSTNSIL